MIDPGAIRALAGHDLDACVEVAATVGWTTDAQQWRRMLSLGEAHGIGLADGTLAGTIVVLPFGTELTMIAMMLVRPTCQRQGVGRRLMEHALERASTRLVALYATPIGEKLYRKLGFVDAGASTRFEGVLTPQAEPRPGDLRPITGADLDAVLALDEATQGTWRDGLLRALVDDHESAWIVERAGRIAGFGFAASKRATRRLGPIVAPLDADALALADRLALGAPRVLLDLEPGESVLEIWAKERGLRAAEISLRMTRGAGALAGARSWSRSLAGRPYG